MPRHELAVLEGRWFDGVNNSVRPVFDTLVDMLHNTPHAYFYHQFSNASSLRHLIERVAETQARFLYLGAHGDGSSIYGYLRDEGDDEALKGSDSSTNGKIPRRVLRRVLYDCGARNLGSFDGLFLGSCAMVNQDNATFLFEKEKGPDWLRWVAGYGGDVDWMESTLLDVLFFRHLLGRTTGTPTQRVRKTARYVEKHAGGLCKHLSFQVYTRRPGSGGRVKALISYP